MAHVAARLIPKQTAPATGAELLSTPAAGTVEVMKRSKVHKRTVTRNNRVLSTKGRKGPRQTGFARKAASGLSWMVIHSNDRNPIGDPSIMRLWLIRSELN